MFYPLFNLLSDGLMGSWRCKYFIVRSLVHVWTIQTAILTLPWKMSRPNETRSLTFSVWFLLYMLLPLSALALLCAPFSPSFCAAPSCANTHKLEEYKLARTCMHAVTTPSRRRRKARIDKIYEDFSFFINGKSTLWLFHFVFIIHFVNIINWFSQWIYYSFEYSELSRVYRIHWMDSVHTMYHRRLGRRRSPARSFVLSFVLFSGTANGIASIRILPILAGHSSPLNSTPFEKGQPERWKIPKIRSNRRLTGLSFKITWIYDNGYLWKNKYRFRRETWCIYEIYFFPHNMFLIFVGAFCYRKTKTHYRKEFVKVFSK